MLTSVSVAIPFAGHWYFDTVVQGLRDALAAEGHHLTVHVRPPGQEGRSSAVDVLDGSLATAETIGAVAVQFRPLPEQSVRLMRHDKPVVLIGGSSPDLPTVRLDDVEIARRATRVLLELGHTRVAHLAGYAVGPDDFEHRAHRVRGYSEAMHEAGLAGEAEVVPSGFDLDDARRQAGRLLRASDRPTAIFAVTDEVAFGVLAAAESLDLTVPGDLSVIGIDDHPRSARVGLSTIRQAPEQSGMAAAARILGRTDSDDQIVDACTILRSSTAEPRTAAREVTARPFWRRRP